MVEVVISWMDLLDVYVQMDTQVKVVRLHQTGACIRALFNAELMEAVMKGCVYVQMGTRVKVVRLHQTRAISKEHPIAGYMEHVALLEVCGVSSVSAEMGTLVIYVRLNQTRACIRALFDAELMGAVMVGNALVMMAGPEEHAKYENVLETRPRAFRPKTKISAYYQLYGSLRQNGLRLGTAGRTPPRRERLSPIAFQNTRESQMQLSGFRKTSTAVLFALSNGLRDTQVTRLIPDRLIV